MPRNSTTKQPIGITIKSTATNLLVGDTGKIPVEEIRGIVVGRGLGLGFSHRFLGPGIPKEGFGWRTLIPEYPAGILADVGDALLCDGRTGWGRFEPDFFGSYVINRITGGRRRETPGLTGCFLFAVLNTPDDFYPVFRIRIFCLVKPLEIGAVGVLQSPGGGLLCAGHPVLLGLIPALLPGFDFVNGGLDPGFGGLGGFFVGHFVFTAFNIGVLIFILEGLGWHF